MTTVKVDLPEDLNDMFKKKVFDVYGLKKGVISKALKDMIETWVYSDVPDKFINYDEIRANYPGKYIVMEGTKVILVKNKLKEIYSELPSIENHDYRLITPEFSGLKRGRRLGWRMKKIKN